MTNAPLVGIIANPASGKDIRRLVACRDDDRLEDPCRAGQLVRGRLVLGRGRQAIDVTANGVAATPRLGELEGESGRLGGLGQLAGAVEGDGEPVERGGRADAIAGCLEDLCPPAERGFVRRRPLQRRVSTGLASAQPSATKASTRTTDHGTQATSAPATGAPAEAAKLPTK